MSSPCRAVVLSLRGSLVGKKKLATVSGRAREPIRMSSSSSSCRNLFGPALLVFFSWLHCCPSSGVHWPRLPSSLSLVLSSSSPLVLLVLFSFPHPFVLCCHCCPAAVMLFTLLSEAGAGAAAAHHHNNNSCRLSFLGSTLTQSDSF